MSVISETQKEREYMRALHDAFTRNYEEELDKQYTLWLQVKKELGYEDFDLLDISIDYYKRAEIEYKINQEFKRRFREQELKETRKRLAKLAIERQQTKLNTRKRKGKQ